MPKTPDSQNENRKLSVMDLRVLEFRDGDHGVATASLKKRLPGAEIHAEAVATALADVARTTVSEKSRKMLTAWLKGNPPPTPPARMPKEPSLSGRVTGIADGAGRVGLTVRGFAKGLKEDVLLAELAQKVIDIIVELGHIVLQDSAVVYHHSGLPFDDLAKWPALFGNQSAKKSGCAEDDQYHNVFQGTAFRVGGQVGGDGTYGDPYNPVVKG